jgi:hypothetical protein
LYNVAIAYDKQEIGLLNTETRHDKPEMISYKAAISHDEYEIGLYNTEMRQNEHEIGFYGGELKAENCEIKSGEQENLFALQITRFTLKPSHRLGEGATARPGG